MLDSGLYTSKKKGLNSWSKNINNVDKETWDLTVKNPNIVEKIDELREKDFSNIVVAGQSCGGFLSIYLTAHFPDKIKGSIVTNPACYGKNVKPRNIEGNKSTFSEWKSLRDDWEQTISQFSEINSLAFIHDKDPFENSTTLSFLTKMNKIKIIHQIKVVITLNVM